jgi:hypothetical protein
MHERGALGEHGRLCAHRCGPADDGDNQPGHAPPSPRPAPPLTLPEPRIDRCIDASHG